MDEEETPEATEDGLPTRDTFRQRFRDAARVGLPLSKCLDFGTRWTGKSTPTEDKKAFKDAVRGALASGNSVTDALSQAAKLWEPPMRTNKDSYVAELEKTSEWLTMKAPSPVKPGRELKRVADLCPVDIKRNFKAAMRDAMASGVAADKALKKALETI